MRDLDTERAEDRKVWVADASPELNGLLVLGTPLGSREFVRGHAARRLAEEQELLD